MPTYVYKFVKTGETIEVQQAFDDDALTQAVHPESGRRMTVKKVFTPVGVSFKGDGFYKTDSRSKSSKAAASAESKSGDSTSKSGDSTSTSSDSSSKSGDSTSSESKKGDAGSPGPNRSADSASSSPSASPKKADAAASPTPTSR